MSAPGIGVSMGKATTLKVAFGWIDDASSRPVAVSAREMVRFERATASEASVVGTMDGIGSDGTIAWRRWAGGLVRPLLDREGDVIPMGVLAAAWRLECGSLERGSVFHDGEDVAFAGGIPAHHVEYRRTHSGDGHRPAGVALREAAREGLLASASRAVVVDGVLHWPAPAPLLAFDVVGGRTRPWPWRTRHVGGPLLVPGSATARAFAASLRASGRGHGGREAPTAPRGGDAPVDEAALAFPGLLDHANVVFARMAQGLASTGDSTGILLARRGKEAAWDPSRDPGLVLRVPAAVEAALRAGLARDAAVAGGLRRLAAAATGLAQAMPWAFAGSGFPAAPVQAARPTNVGFVAGLPDGTWGGEEGRDLASEAADDVAELGDGRVSPGLGGGPGTRAYGTHRGELVAEAIAAHGLAVAVDRHATVLSFADVAVSVVFDGTRARLRPFKRSESADASTGIAGFLAAAGDAHVGRFAGKRRRPGLASLRDVVRDVATLHRRGPDTFVVEQPADGGAASWHLQRMDIDSKLATEGPGRILDHAVASHVRGWESLDPRWEPYCALSNMEGKGVRATIRVPAPTASATIAAAERGAAMVRTIAWLRRTGAPPDLVAGVEALATA